MQNFGRVLYTARNMQLALMTLQPGEESCLLQTTEGVCGNRGLAEATIFHTSHQTYECDQPGDNVKTPFNLDGSIVLTALTVIGMVLAILALWPLQGDAASLASTAGPALVYLAGGLPAGWRAATTLWEERILDIDLLMVVAAVAAAAVGAPFEGAVLLTLFSISTTLEERALGRARRAIEALMALR